MSVRQRTLFVLTLLFVMVIGSALTLIYSKHHVRKLFVELQHSLSTVDELNAEWSRLQLEQGAWSEHGRVERKARENLLMKRPLANEVVFVNLDTGNE